jgi:D-alanine-D-alanine ligase
MENRNIKVALLVGGTSPEREVSKSTCKSIYSALQKLNYSVSVIDPAYGLNQPENVELFFDKKDFCKISNKNQIEAINSKLLDDVDVAFIGIHGKWGEDGILQSLLEMRGIKYTGSKVLASALSMNKYMAKIMFQHFNVNTPKWFVVTNTENDFMLIDQKIKKFFGYPCVIKPNDQGSTIGLSICNNENELIEAIRLSLQFSNLALVEEYIPGRELAVTVLGNRSLPVLEIKPVNGFYDYEHKYTSGMSEYQVPADIPENVAKHLQQQALLAFNSIGCDTYARIDFRLTEDYHSYCLEVNTLPGMTNLSLVPKMAAAAGITFEELIDQIIKLSF